MFCCWTLVISILSVSVASYFYFSKRKKLLSLNDKVVMIVGASSGIGEACAYAFYKNNCNLILCARRKAELERVKKDVESSNSNIKAKITLIQIDVSNFDEIPKIIEECLKVHNGIDILINNAGVSYRGKIADTLLSVDQSVMNVNYFGQVAVTKEVLKDMIDKRSGHIVFISSLQGKLSIPFRSAYSASKHAIQAFADCLRAEVAQFNIGVSVISPAYVRTNLSLNAVKSDGSTYGVMDNNQKTGMDPSEVASAVVEAIEYDDNEVLLAKFTYRVVVYFRNILPDIYFKVMARRAFQG